MTTTTTTTTTNDIYQWVKRKQEKYPDFNIIPVREIIRTETGEKKILIDAWQKFQSERCLQEHYQSTFEYKNVALVCGRISNITVVDVDSEAALQTLMNSTGLEFSELSQYIVKTRRGFHLFYRYIPLIRSRINIQDKIDILNDGKLSFALEINEGYQLVVDKGIKDMPERMLKMITNDGVETLDNEILLFEKALRESSDFFYRSPIQPIISDFVQNPSFTKEHEKAFKKIFLTKQYKNLTFKEFIQEGRRYETHIYVGSIVAADPTVDFKLYVDFMGEWARKVLKLDLTNEKNIRDIKNRIEAGKKIFNYDPNWYEKHSSLSSIKTEEEEYNFRAWQNPERDGEYNFIDGISKILRTFTRANMKEHIAHFINSRSIDAQVKPKDIDTVRFDRVVNRFNPFIDDEFYKDPETNEKCYNLFKRPVWLQYIKVCKPRQDPPLFIGNLIKHIIPESNERNIFLHALAYHMHTLQPAQTMFILYGKPGTGKNTFLDGVLSQIYGEYFKQTDDKTLTSRFRGDLANKLLIFIDEVTERPTSPSQRGTIHAVIKQIVANRKISIEQKGIEEKTYNNYSFVVMATNKQIPFTLEESEDRRVNIFKTSDARLDTHDWFPEDIYLTIQKEIQHFVEYLASFPLDIIKAKTIVNNRHKKLMIKSSTPTWQRIVDAIIYKDTDELEEHDSEFAEWYDANIIQKNRAYITDKELSHYFSRDTTKKMTTEFQSRGIAKKRLSVAAIRHTIYVINPEGKMRLEDDFENYKKE